MTKLDKIKADFRLFMWVIWKHLDLPDPTPIQYDIALYLQHGSRRRMVQAFRGVGKSWITAAFVLWRLLKNPEERILVVSASKDRADAFSVFLKRLIDEVPILQHLRPDPTQGHRDSIMAFDVGTSSAHQAPSVRSVGITGQLTGGRATIIVADDVEVPKNSMTQTMRDRLAESVKEFDAVLVPDGEVVYLGTPQTEMSLYNTLPERGYDIRIWPARYVSIGELNRYKGKLASMILARIEDGSGKAGTTTDPNRFTDLDLMERERSYGRSGFALQFMLDTSLSDADRYPLKINDLMSMDLDNEIAPVKVAWASGKDVQDTLESVGFPGDRWNKPMWISSGENGMAKYQGSVLFIDPSGRGKDESGYAVVKMLNGMLYLMDCGGFREGYTPKTLTALADKAREYKVNSVVIEDNFGDGMFSELFKPYLVRAYPVSVDEDFLKGRRAHGQKEKRIIDTLEPVLNQHRLVVSRKLIERDMTNYNEHPGDTFAKYSLFYQLTRITRDKGALLHDDRLDALAGAVSYWVEEMNRDQDKIEAEHNDKLLDEELIEFMEHVLGEDSKSDCFWG